MRSGKRRRSFGVIFFIPLDIADQALAPFASLGFALPVLRRFFVLLSQVHIPRLPVSQQDRTNRWNFPAW